ncbi:ABC transporter permease [Glycomyces algeriensis]|uniref:ABC transporter permease n=1 Tax=Glycomyces algeriensis TaxID=256037 RepID=A0A9W6LEY6_9ACTN|nr:ABC transporter permease [Glycomyces algeriensis]MDA1367228.1 ABC transporter permease [Glycomyces algeriensis]MDR7353388.1 peptide/nickel transport system permease protein [Glycomyces algeriensis]GLI41083.1 ABC transporter permease [Glycomyces algeriensis]
MLAYAAKRIGLGAVQVLAVAVLAFALVELLPGDAAVALAGDQPDPANIARIREQMHLDEPALARLADWLGGLLTGDFGASIVSGRPVADLLATALEPTLILAAATLILLLPLSIGLGVAAARRQGRWPDRIITTFTVGLYSVPEFALAVLLVSVFAIGLAWLPPTAVGVPSLLAEPAVLVLPLLVLLARPICSIARLVRAGMIEALDSEYVAHARRAGVSERRVVLAHALPNAVTPATAQIARTADWLLGGVIVVESVFVIPGLGTALVDAVNARDLPVVQGIAVVFGATTVLVNLAADLVAFRLAPRMEVAR